MSPDSFITNSIKYGLKIKATHDYLLISTGKENLRLKIHKQMAYTFSPSKNLCFGESIQTLYQLALLSLAHSVSDSLPCFLPFPLYTRVVPSLFLFLNSTSTYFLSHIPGSGGHTAAAAWWPPYPQRDRAAHIPAAGTFPAGKGPKGSLGPAPEKHKGKINM